MSSRPTPCAPARALSCWIASSIVTGLPSIATGTPASNVMTTSSASRGSGRVGGVGVDVLDRTVPDVLEEAGLDRPAPHVLVDRVRRLLGHVDRQVVRLGELDGLVAGHRQVAHRGDAGQVGSEVGDADLEADLVVALAGAAVADDGRVVLPGGGDQVLDDRRPGQRRDQRIAIHVEGVGLERGQAVLVGELLLGVDDVGVHGATVEGPLADDVEVLTALADVDGAGDHLGAGLARRSSRSPRRCPARPSRRVRRGQPCSHSSRSWCGRRTPGSASIRICACCVRGAALTGEARPAPGWRRPPPAPPSGGAGDEQDGVVAGDRPDHVGPVGTVDRRREVLRGTRGRAQHDDVGRVIDADQHVLGDPRQPGDACRRPGGARSLSPPSAAPRRPADPSGAGTLTAPSSSRSRDSVAWVTASPSAASSSARAACEADRRALQDVDDAAVARRLRVGDRHRSAPADPGTSVDRRGRAGRRSPAVRDACVSRTGSTAAPGG